MSNIVMAWRWRDADRAELLRRSRVLKQRGLIRLDDVARAHQAHGLGRDLVNDLIARVSQPARRALAPDQAEQRRADPAVEHLVLGDTPQDVAVRRGRKDLDRVANERERDHLADAVRRDDHLEELLVDRGAGARPLELFQAEAQRPRAPQRPRSRDA